MTEQEKRERLEQKLDRKVDALRMDHGYPSVKKVFRYLARARNFNSNQQHTM